MYFSLNVWIIPRERGWSLNLHFGGKNTILIWSYLPFISGGWQGALSKNKITFLRFRANFRLSLNSTSSRMLKSIQALGCLKYEQGSWDVSLIVLKQLGFFDLPIAIDFSLPPTKKENVTLSLDFFPPVHCFDTSARDLFGSARKIDLFRPCWRCSLGSSRSRYSVNALAKMLQFPP